MKKGTSSLGSLDYQWRKMNSASTEKSIKLNKRETIVLESYQKEMINRLHTVGEKEFLKQKIIELSKLAKRLRTTQSCNADYENYKELEAKIA